MKKEVYETVQYVPLLLPVSYSQMYSLRFVLRCHLCSSLVKDQVLHLYKTVGKIIVLFVLIFDILHSWNLKFSYLLPKFNCDLFLPFRSIGNFLHSPKDYGRETNNKY